MYQRKENIYACRLIVSCSYQQLKIIPVSQALERLHGLDRKLLL